MEKIKGTPEQQLARRQLVDALRSGKYEQTTGKLRQGDSFCCLGVACDISELGKWRFYETSGETAYIFGRDLTSGSFGILPPPVAERLGFSSNGDFASTGAVISERGVAHCLYNLNDSLAWPFAQIADFIEERWEVAPAAQPVV